MKKIRCNTCGHRFHIIKADVYIVSEKVPLVETLKKAARRFNAMDCPRCGCQKVLSIRMDKDGGE